MASTSGRVSGAESGRKLLAVLLSFDGSHPRWNLSQLSEELQLSSSSTYRYMSLLREVGLLEPLGGGGFRLTERVLALAAAARADHEPLLAAAHPVMVRLRDAFDETVLLARRGGMHVYCMDRVESRQPVRLQYERGQAMPLHLGSLARILLASMPRADRDSYLESVAGVLTAHQSRLLTEGALDRVLKDGQTQSSQEIDDGIWGTAAAVRDGRGVVASLGTAAPMYRLDEARKRSISARVSHGALEVSAALEPSLDPSATASYGATEEP